MTGAGYEVKCAGRVRLQLIEAWSIHSRTDKTRADDELKENRPSRTSAVRVKKSQNQKVQRTAYQAHHLPCIQVNNWISCQKEENILKESVNSTVTNSRTATEFDIVTPNQEDICALQEAGAAQSSPTSPTVGQDTKPRGRS